MMTKTETKEMVTQMVAEMAVTDEKVACNTEGQMAELQAKVAAEAQARHDKRARKMQGYADSMTQTFGTMTLVNMFRTDSPQTCECCGHPRLQNVHVVQAGDLKFNVGVECAARLTQTATA